MIPDIVGGFAIRHLPGDFAAVEVYRGDYAVWRLHDREALNIESADSRTGGLLRPSELLCQRRIGRRAEARTEGLAKRQVLPAREIAHIREACRRLTKRDDAQRSLLGLRIERVRFRIVSGARPVRAASAVSEINGAEPLPFRIADDRRREHAFDAVARYDIARLGAHLGCEVDQIVGNL